MFNRKSHISSRTPRAFTLVELLIVIAIIGLLMSLLVPAINKVRIAGQKVVTQALINKIEQGCEAYFQDFGAYPGPFSDAQVVSSKFATFAAAQAATPELTPGGVNLQVEDPASPGNYIDLGHAPTSSENLFVGLCGGLRVNPANPPVTTVTTFRFDRELAKRGAGPAGLSLTVAKKSQSYLELSAGDISSTLETSNPLNNPDPAVVEPSEWWPNATKGPALQTGFLGDSRIYEFVDTFKVRRPILYMRANRGVNRTAAVNTNRTGFIYDPTDTTTQNQTTPWQYRPDQIQYAYSNVGPDNKLSTINTATAATADRTGKIWHASKYDYPKVLNEAGTLTKYEEGDERYFVNEQISTGNPTLLSDGNKVLSPIHKDKFILISAGPDGLYGTADDIRN